MTAAPKNYQRHRDNQRERILEAAEALFIRDGLDNVSLSSIASAARMARITLYEYFPNKEEIAWAILHKIFETSRPGPARLLEGSGFAQIEDFMLGMLRQVEENPAHGRFIVEFNALYARQASSERMRQLTGRSSGSAGGRIAGLVRAGIADGSLRADLDPVLVSAALWNLVSGMNSRFALLGGQIQQEYDLDVPTIYTEIINTFLRGLRAQEKGALGGEL
jgi:TetR/AcrR family transcriptional regulator